MILKSRIPLRTFDLDVDVSFEADVTSIFGPSGSGKTTLLDAIAGLRSVESGEIQLGEKILFSSSRGINLTPQDRSIGYVPQELALFPHFSVKENILFGAERGSNLTGRADISLEHVTVALEIHHLLDRSIAYLSGGESQRVALARAVLSRPQLLLLDEPLASLDIGLKERIMPYLLRIRDEFGIPMIYVSHNPTEVLCLADWIVVLKDGKVAAQGVPRDILTSQWVLPDLAENQVENVFAARVIDSDLRAGRSRVRLASDRHLFVPYTDAPPGSPLQIRIRGDDIIVATKQPEGISAANVLPGLITDIETMDGQSILKVDAGEVFCVRITTGAVDRLNLSEGCEIFLVIKTRSCVPL